MINSKLPFFFYGGDYNPDQWPEEIIEQDLKLLKLANVNIVTLPVFSWAIIQPDEETYNFEWLDKILNLLEKNNIFVCLATSTAAQPAWMSRKYPDMLPVDFSGIKHKHGGRVKFCPTNTKYRELSIKLASKLAERYKDYHNIVLWHVGNEYDNYCYCDHCQNEFRNWLKKRYGTLDNLNRAWNMNFWGHTVYSWEEIVAPSALNEMWNGPEKTCTTFQGIALDYNRFMSDSILECYLGEYNAIKKITPDIKITTNLMGTFKPLDYFKWAKHMDIVSWDNYPTYGTHHSTVAMRHDLMRGLKGGEPFMLIEQSPNQANWESFNAVKRPGEIKLQSYQAIAHGSDSVMFFQMRQSIGACEKYHGALIAHGGDEKTRIFKECKELGEELHSLGDSILDSKISSKVAIMFDWDNWWAIEFSSGPSILLKYLPNIEKYYRGFYEHNIPVDFIQSTDDLTKYDVVVAPVLYMLKDTVADNIKNFVSNGGTFITTFFSGYVDENDLVKRGGFPSELRDLLGIWVEELDALPPDKYNSIQMNNTLDKFEKEYKCNLLFDLINLESAEPLGVYGSDFYKGRPVFTRNKFGKGFSYYVGTDPELSFIDALVDQLDSGLSLSLNIIDPLPGVEITKRIKNNNEIYFILNHNDKQVSLNLKDNLFINLITNEKITNEKITNKLILNNYNVAILEKR